jgi:hypothetical protein
MHHDGLHRHWFTTGEPTAGSLQLTIDSCLQLPTPSLNNVY